MARCRARKAPAAAQRFNMAFLPVYITPL